MSKRLAVGLVGVGIHGERYARHLLEDVSGARLEAICRSRVTAGEVFARRHGVRFIADWRHLVRDPGVDAVAVVTPPSLTPAVVRAALRAGKPVVAEKPLVASRAAAQGLRRVAGRTGTPLLVAQTMRWDVTVRALRKALAQVGRIRLVSVVQRLDAAARAWLDQEAGGDALLNTGVHGFDLLRHLTGREVEEVWCRTGSPGGRRQADTFVAGLRLGGGVLATVDNCRAAGARMMRIDVVGEDGILAADPLAGSVILTAGHRARSLAVRKPTPTVRAVLRDFVRVARGNLEPPVSLEDGLLAAEIALACRRSARQGGTVRLGSAPA